MKKGRNGFLVYLYDIWTVITIAWAYLNAATSKNKIKSFLSTKIHYNEFKAEAHQTMWNNPVYIFSA